MKSKLRLLIFFFFATPALAQTEIERIIELAEKGNVEAQARLGSDYFYGVTRYKDGSGVEKDQKKAIKWLLKAANRGDSSSQLLLADYYFRDYDDNQEIKRDYVSSLKWFNIALPALYEAETNVTISDRKKINKIISEVEFKIGSIFYQECSPHYISYFGCQPEKPLDRALKNLSMAQSWFIKSAQRSNKDAQYELGGMYELGLGTPQNFSQAIYWYTKAAENGIDNARCPLGELHLRLRDYVAAHMWFNLAQAASVSCSEKAASARDALSRLMTPDQIVKAQKLATAWSERYPLRP